MLTTAPFSRAILIPIGLTILIVSALSWATTERTDASHYPNDVFHLAPAAWTYPSFTHWDCSIWQPKCWLYGEDSSVYWGGVYVGTQTSVFFATADDAPWNTSEGSWFTYDLIDSVDPSNNYVNDDYLCQDIASTPTHLRPYHWMHSDVNKWPYSEWVTTTDCWTQLTNDIMVIAVPQGQ